MPMPETITKALDAIRLIPELGTISRALKTVDLSDAAFQDCRRSVREVSLAYALAREACADRLADEMLELSDSDGDPMKVKIQVDTRKWLASKYKPSVFAERVELNVSQSISILDTRTEALGRVLPGRYQPLIQDAEVIDPPALDTHRASDKQSDAPAEPDIFS